MFFPAINQVHPDYSPELERFIARSVEGIEFEGEKVIGGKMISRGGPTTDIVGYRLFTSKYGVFNGYVDYNDSGLATSSHAGRPIGYTCKQCATPREACGPCENPACPEMPDNADRRDQMLANIAADREALIKRERMNALRNRSFSGRSST